MTDLVKYRDLICDVCFTISWEPVDENYPGAIIDPNGGWMVCGYCRLVETLRNRGYELAVKTKGLEVALAFLKQRDDERSSVISLLRQLCEEFGDNDWPDTLHLHDAIEKHLARHLWNEPLPETRQFLWQEERKLRIRLSKVLVAITDIEDSVFAESFAGVYEKRDDYMNGWNACTMRYLEKIGEILTRFGVTIDNAGGITIDLEKGNDG